jgi:hypothetical protein
MCLLAVVKITVACAPPKTGIATPEHNQDISGTNEANKPFDSEFPQEIVPPGIGPDVSLVDAVYHLNATSLLGIKVCEGDVKVKINPVFNQVNTNKIFDIPEGILNCGLIGKINLGEAFGAFASGTPPQLLPEGVEAVEVKDKVLRLRQLGYGLYTPSRPLLPSFLNVTANELPSIGATVGISLKDTKDGKSGSGTVSLKMLSTGGVVDSERAHRKFKKVLKFEVLNQGFDGVDKLTNFLFEKMEFTISLEPLAITSIYFEGRVSEFRGALGGGGVSSDVKNGGIIGALTKAIKVKIQADLVSMEGLDKVGNEEDKPIKEVIGD